MRKVPESLLRRMAEDVSSEDRDEMAIPSYLHKNPALRWMAWRRVTVVADHLAALAATTRPQTILDFGCGTGVLLEECSRHASKVYGVDLVTSGAALLCKEWNLDRVTLLKPDAARAEIAPGSLDIIVAAEVLEHVEPLDEALATFRTWLRPGGKLLVSLPTENQLYRLGRRLAGFHGHYHHTNASTIEPEIRKAGFTRDRLEKVPLGGPLSIYWVADFTK